MSLRTVLELLLQGEFICQVSHPKYYQLLKFEEVLLEINTVLVPLGRKLHWTEEKETFYCVYDDLSNSNDATQIRKQFEQLRYQIAPVIDFLTLVMKAEGKGEILIPNDILQFHELLSHIESEPAYSMDLKRIGRYELFKKTTKKNNNQDRLKEILETMRKEGYMELTNADSAIYQVTGKIEYFYNCVEFIRDHEQVPLQEESDEQKDLRFDH